MIFSVRMPCKFFCFVLIYFKKSFFILGGIMKKEIRIIFVIGFSLFAMFFGAGNLIFPTFLGYNSGSYWPIAFILYMVATERFATLLKNGIHEYV